MSGGRVQTSPRSMTFQSRMLRSIISQMYSNNGLCEWINITRVSASTTSSESRWERKTKEEKDKKNTWNSLEICQFLHVSLSHLYLFILAHSYFELHTTQLPKMKQWGVLRNLIPRPWSKSLTSNEVTWETLTDRSIHTPSERGQVFRVTDDNCSTEMLKTLVPHALYSVWLARKPFPLAWLTRIS